MLWFLDLHCGFLLASLKDVGVSLILGSPAPDSTPDVSHQWLAEGRDYFPRPASNIQPNATQPAIGRLCHEGTLLAPVQPGVHQDLQVPFCKATFHMVSPRPVVAHGGYLSSGTQLCNSFYWDSHLNVCWLPMFSTCWDPSERWCHLLVYQPPFPIFYHLQMC